jgi:hypothetical protein
MKQLPTAAALDDIFPQKWYRHRPFQQADRVCT